MMRPLFRVTTMSRAAEFFVRHPENLLLVKREGAGGMLVCATADNLTMEQKEAFVRYLCAEGFGSGDFESLDGIHERAPDPEVRPVRWIVDSSWPEVDPVYARHLQRLCWCAAGTTVVWLALTVVLVWC